MNREARRKFFGRRSERIAKEGRVLEERIKNLLRELVEENCIGAFRYHTPNSRNDQAGKDFTVRIIRDSREKEVSFGVTISPRRCIISRLKHPQVQQFCFPIGTNPETMKRRIKNFIKETVL